MKIVTFIAAAGVFFFASGADAADHARPPGHSHVAAKRHPVRTVRAVRRARVYDASNVPTRSYGRKSSSFVPRRASHGGTRHGSASRAAVAQNTATPAGSTRPRPSPQMRASEDFRQDHPCPSTGWTTGKCPGFAVVGNPSAPSTLQWQASGAGDPIK